MGVQFISEKYFKDNSLVDQNVDPALIVPTIQLVQDLHLQPILGSSLYNDIVAQITAGTISTNANYKDLLDNYISPCLVWWVMAKLVVPLTFRFKSTAVNTNSTEKGMPISMSDADKLKERYSEDAQFYGERITKHLRANPTLFPLYLSFTGNSIERIPPQSNAYNTGMVLTKNWNGKKIPFHELYDGPNGIAPEGYDPDYTNDPLNNI